MNVSCPTCRFSTHSLTDTAIALVCFGLIMVAMVLHAVAKLITIYYHIISNSSHILIWLLLQIYSTNSTCCSLSATDFVNIIIFSQFYGVVFFINASLSFSSHLHPLPPQLTAQRPSGLSSPSGSDSAPQCLMLERHGEAEAKAQQIKEHTADISSPQDHVPIHPGIPTDPLAEILFNEDGHTKAQSPVPSRASSPRSPCLTHSPPPCSPSSPRCPVSANVCLCSPVNGQTTGVHPKPKDPNSDSRSNPCGTEAQTKEEKGGDVKMAPQQTDGSASTPAAPRKDPSRKQSRIPVLEPSCLLELAPPGSAKEKLLQKRASHQGSVPSPTASPSLSDRRGPIVASLVRDPLSSNSDRSQDEDSLMGSRSDRQGDEALSLSSSSSPLSRKSRIPRPVHPASSAEQLNAQFLPRPPPGKPPYRPTAEGR